jgi:hypothetical protein
MGKAFGLSRAQYAANLIQVVTAQVPPTQTPRTGPIPGPMVTAPDPKLSGANNAPVITR